MEIDVYLPAAAHPVHRHAAIRRAVVHALRAEFPQARVTMSWAAVDHPLAPASGIRADALGVAGICRAYAIRNAAVAGVLRGERAAT